MRRVSSKYGGFTEEERLGKVFRRRRSLGYGEVVFVSRRRGEGVILVEGICYRKIVRFGDLAGSV